MFLGLDLGTTNVKALVADRAGQPLAQGSQPVSLHPVPEGGVEQDLEEIWQATLAALREALRPVDPAAIESIGISSQGGALQLLGGDGQPRGRVISWLDGRGRPWDELLDRELGGDWFAQRIGHGGCGLAAGQLLRLRQQHPEMLEPPNRIGFVGDILVCRLCGRRVQDGTSAGLTLLYNPTLRHYDPDLLLRLGLTTGQLPALDSPRSAAGGLRPEIARQTGLRAEIPVSVAIHDQYAAALGTRAVQAGTVMLGTGTAWVLLAVSDRLIPPVTPQAFLCHHVVDGLGGQILSLVNGGSALNWALELTGQPRADRAPIDRLLEETPPGCDGLRCWPLLSPSTPAGLPPGTRGRLSGLRLEHRPAHLIRAVVEGLACEVKRHLDFLRGSGIQVVELALGGGAATSRVTPQILADVTGLPLVCMTAAEVSLVGATILARGLVEPASSLANLARQMVQPGRRVDPGAHALRYQDLYRQYLSF